MYAQIRLAASPLPAGAPHEFRLFRRGENPTSKGTIIFDDAAAKAVMAVYARQGVDVMIDLEHESLSAPTRPDSGDARGWCKLAVRNGELWAVDVRWAPDGARRLREKTQRYSSPAVRVDDAGRAIELINIALTAMPATHGAHALIAASRYTRTGSAMVGTRLPKADVSQLKKLANTLGSTVGVTLRGLIQLALKDPEKTLVEVGKLLGLPPDALPSEIANALGELVANVGGEPDPNADALADTAQSLNSREQRERNNLSRDLSRGLELSTTEKARAKQLRLI